MNSEDEVPVKMTAQQFKEKFGYSRTQKRNMLKKGINVTDQLAVNVALTEMRMDRKDRKAKIRKIQARKSEDSRIYMRTKGKVRKSKHKKRTKGWQSGGKGRPSMSTIVVEAKK